MRSRRLPFLLGLFFAFAISLPLRAADQSATQALTALGVQVSKLPGGGSNVRVPSAKLKDEELWKQLAALGDLKTFGVRDLPFDNAALTRLSQIPTVESLMVINPGFDDAGMAVLAKLPNFRTINIDHGVSLSGVGFAPLAGTKLTMINVGGSHINDQGMEAIGKLTQLTDCTLRHIKISRVGFAHVANLTALKKFTYSGSYHPNMDASDLRALSSCKDLEELMLSELILTYDNGLSHLKGLTKLKKVTLATCGLSEADLEKFKADHPEAKVTFTPASAGIVKGYHEAVEKLKAEGGEKK